MKEANNSVKRDAVLRGRIESLGHVPGTHEVSTLSGPDPVEGGKELTRVKSMSATKGIPGTSDQALNPNMPLGT